MGLEVKQVFQNITRHVFLYPASKNDRPNVSLIAGKKYSLLFDAGFSEDHILSIKDALKNQNLPYPSGVIISHAHCDHCFGAGAWKLPIIACRDTQARLKAMQSWLWTDDAMENREKNGEEIAFCNANIRLEYPNLTKINIAVADIVFDQRLSIDLGDLIIELICCNGPHGQGVICYIPSDKILLIADMAGKDLYSMPWTFQGDFRTSVNKIPYDHDRVSSFIQLLDSLDFLYYIDGHTGAGYRESLYRMLHNEI